MVNGTTGESPTTTDHEQQQVVQAVVEAVGDRATVVAGASSNDTLHAIERGRLAEKAGADGLLVVSPYYNKPPQAGVLQHLTMVAEAIDLPVMLYDIPGRTGVAIDEETMVRAAEHERIRGGQRCQGRSRGFVVGDATHRLGVVLGRRRPDATDTQYWRGRRRERRQSSGGSKNP